MTAAADVSISHHFFQCVERDAHVTDHWPGPIQNAQGPSESGVTALCCATLTFDVAIESQCCIFRSNSLSVTAQFVECWSSFAKTGRIGLQTAFHVPGHQKPSINATGASAPHWKCQESVDVSGMSHRKQKRSAACSSIFTARPPSFVHLRLDRA